MNPEQIRTLVARSCIAMDREDFASFLELCGADFRYRIRAFSRELNREMLWLDLDRSQLESLFSMIPQHVRLQGSLRRLASVYTIEPANAQEASVTSSFVVTHTDLAGASRLYAAGEFVDTIDTSGERPQLLARDVILDTRMLGAGSHVPI